MLKRRDLKLKLQGLFSFKASLFSHTICMEEFARLLPSLDVVAVSQAPSPESNPNSPLPVKTTVSVYITVES